MIIDDETLMAFADGELDAERTEHVHEALASDAALRERLEALRGVDNLLRAAVAPSLDIPERFAQLLKPSATVTDIATKRRSTRSWIIPAGTAIAAGFATLMFANILTPQSDNWLRHVKDGVAISGAVELAAINTPSGQLVKSGDLNIRPIMSFVANDGRSCRELHIRDKEMAARIVACRDQDEDEWCIQAMASMPANDFPDSYHTAGVKKDPIIDAAYARLGVKEVLDEKSENATIARKWAH